MEEQLAADLETVVADREIILQTTTEARQSKIQGKKVQSEIKKLLDNHNPLFRLCRFEYTNRVEGQADSSLAAAEDLSTEGYIDNSTKQEFEDLWDEIDWIVPAVSVSVQDLGGMEEHWSNTSMKLKNGQPDILQYTVRWGVDEKIDADIPASRVVMRNVAELHSITEYFKFWREDDDIDDELISHLADRFDIGVARDNLRTILDELEKIDTEGGQPPASTDPDIDVIWDDSIGDENVVGKIRVSPPGEKAADPDDDPDRIPRGFQ